jgi:hypothetical protein
MEVDCSASEECKESNGGALLVAGEGGEGSLDESSMQMEQGQQLIWEGCPTLSKL